MRFNMIKIVTILIAIIYPVTVYAIDGSQILRKVDRNLNPESYESYRKLINIEPDGRKKEFVLLRLKKDRIK